MSEQPTYSIASSGHGSPMSGSGDAIAYNYNTSYQFTPSRPIDNAALAAALALLADLPLDRIPAPAVLPPSSRMPLSPNPLFVGRVDDLRALAASLKTGTTAAISPVAATGMGGIGKTQLAVEFVHRYGRYFAGGTFWLSFADPAAIPTEIAACADLRQYPYLSSLPLADQVRHVLSDWQSPLPRLLVFDNCEDENLLATWRPDTGGARVLVTCRRAEWSAALGVQVLPLGLLARAESIALLCKHRPDLPAADPVLDAVAAELGDLPLALDLAGSFLARYRTLVTPAAYLADLGRPDLLAHRSLSGSGYSSTQHELSVGRTFALSYDRLDPADPIDTLARALLARAAYFAPGEPIPRELLLPTLDLDAEGSDAVYRAADAWNRLLELGLLEQQAGATVRLHRLLAAFIQNMAANTTAQTTVERVILAEAAKLRITGYPAQLAAIQPHLRAATDRAQRRGDTLAADLCNELGLHLEALSDYAQARRYLEQALTLRARLLGPEHHDTAASLNNLADLLRSMGEYEVARSLFERTLAICMRTLGPTHLLTAACLNNLALLLHAQNNYAAARPLSQHALLIHASTYGPEHPGTATSIDNLASVLHDQGEHAGARALYERALAIRERVLGPDHPDTATSLNNLAELVGAKEDYVTARALFERALAIREHALGPDHPDTAASLNNLALLLLGQKDYAAAMPLLERALAINERTLGPYHPNTAAGLDNLAGLLHDQGGFAAARPLYERALAIRERVFGPNHPETATSLNNMACLFRDQGAHAAARPQYERALAICERALGPHHLRTIEARQKLAALPSEDSP